MDDTFIYYGSAVKDLGAGRVGGHLVLFTGETDPDLAREFFTRATDFEIEDGAETPVRYHHGLDPVLKRRTLGRGTMKMDDVGVWVEAQLALRDGYEQAIYAMAKAGKLGWSSGSAPHLVEYRERGAAKEILSWPLGLDASLTPIPCEPRCSAVALKSLPPPPPLSSESGGVRALEDAFDEFAAAFRAALAPTEAQKSLNGDEAPHGGLRLAAHVEAALAAAERFNGHAEGVLARLGELIEDRTVKSGRHVSPTNLERIEAVDLAAKAVREQCERLRALGAPAPTPDTGAEARRLFASFQQHLARARGADV
jgi:hypothetical protein